MLCISSQRKEVGESWFSSFDGEQIEEDKKNKRSVWVAGNCIIFSDTGNVITPSFPLPPATADGYPLHHLLLLLLVGG